MYILLTDALTCPRCGPEFGLVLLADRIEERRVLEGKLGCANCRESYLLSGGEADLRTTVAPPTEGLAGGSPAGDAQEAAVRIAALLGLADAKGTVLVAGPGADLAGRVAALVPDVEVVAYRAEPVGGEEVSGVSRVAGGARLPFRTRSLRGVALTGGAELPLLAEGVRVLREGARIVVEGASPDTARRLEEAGAAVLLAQEGVVVARAVGEPVPIRPGPDRG